MTRNPRRYALLPLCMLLLACQHVLQTDDGRTDEENATLHALNDSMLHLAPTALRLISQQQQQATDSLTWYDYYLMYGRHYLLTDTPDSLLPYISRTLHYVGSLPRQTPRTRGLAATAKKSEGAYHYLLRHNSDSVIGDYLEAYRLLFDSDTKDQLPNLSANIGDAYVARNDLKEGSKWYRRALYLNDSLGLPERNTLTLYMGLGRIYTTLGDYRQAREYYETADRRFSEMQPNMQSYFLNNYGNFFYFQRDYPQALQTFRRLKAHLEQYGAEEHFDMYLCKINMADVFLNLSQTDSARRYVAEAEPYFREHGVEAGMHYANTIRIGIALHEKHYQDVPRILASEPKHAPGDADLEKIRHEYMNRYYAAIGDYKRAYTGLRGNVEQSDSADQRRRQMRSEDIMMRLTEDTIRLHHQMEMNEQRAHYDKVRLAQWAIAATFVALALLFALWYNHERKRRLKSRLDILQLRLANARQRISPHFVCNVLNSRLTDSNQQENDQLVAMAKLIRTNLEMASKPYVTLADELDFVRQYVELERTLTGEDFNFRVDVPDERALHEVSVPSMLVQILVENAILHGLKGKQGEKRLEISVERDDRETRISVSDNGPGFDIRHYDSERSRTGLSIIRSTVSALNARNPLAKMHFDLHNDNGCHATLTIPRNIKLL